MSNLEIFLIFVFASILLPNNPLATPPSPHPMAINETHSKSTIKKRWQILLNPVGLSLLYFKEKNTVLADRICWKVKNHGQFLSGYYKTKNPPTAWKNSCSILYKPSYPLSFLFSTQTTPFTHYKKKVFCFASVEPFSSFFFQRLKLYSVKNEVLVLWWCLLNLLFVLKYIFGFWVLA